MSETYEQIHNVMWEDFDSTTEFPYKTPLLAHYTTINNFDRIVEGQELWFSNPLNMNDSDELLFGMNQGAAEFRKNQSVVKACGNEEVYSRLMGKFDHYFNDFDVNHALDIYVSCFSMHEVDDYDGALSMWRGYGANGSGIAFVIDTKKIIKPDESSPIILAPVYYATSDDRKKWIIHRINKVAELISKLDKSDHILDSIARIWIERLKVFSLFTKHKGFEEEREWRFVYLSDRDVRSGYSSMYGYNITNKGVEPKLKLRLDQIPGIKPILKLESLIDRVILGPTVSSVLSHRSLERMLELKGKQELARKVYVSSIPYRP